MTEFSGLMSTSAGMGGGWRRLIKINVRQGDDYSSGWLRATYSGVSFCRVVRDDNNICSSTILPTYGISYQRVCGRARGYLKGVSVSFFQNQPDGQMIDLMDYQSLIVTHVNTSGHLLIDYTMMVYWMIMITTTVHVFLVLNFLLLPS